MTEPAPRNLRFIDSMPRPLIAAFLLFAAAGIGLVVWLFVNPPAPSQVALELRRSPPVGSRTHDVLRARLVSVPSPLPSFEAPCATLRGIVVEGGTATVDRIDRALDRICDHLEGFRTPPLSDDVVRAVRGLSTARIRFALFTRTGDLSAADLPERRILLAIALSRTNVPAGVIAPLLVHEGYHLSLGGPVTATQEFGARRAEYEACRVLIPDRDRWPRGCDDALAVVRLGEARAVDLLVRAGYPR
jgi:hypothetical protein